jgi:DNA-binding FadR family transcriptional regulator
MTTVATKSLQRVARTSLVDEVIAAMRTMLSEEGWGAGSKLPSELELSRQLGVGRSTVREALRVLGHLGLVESRSGLGTFVVDRGMPEGRVELPRTPETLQELYEFRRAIEVPASRLAAERRTDEEMHRIEAAWRACGRAVESDSAVEFARLDHVFHLSIVQAAHNRFYVAAYEGIEAAFVNYVNLILGLGPLRSMLHFHDGMIEAIKRQDPDAAVKATEENFVETDIRLRLLMQNAGKP